MILLVLNVTSTGVLSLYPYWSIKSFK